MTKYSNYKREQLEIDITRNIDDIKYWFRKEIVLEDLSREQLEELHTLIDKLYWFCFDL